MSVLLYPLFVPTYGMALFCYAYPLHVAPLAGIWITIALLCTFLFTCVLPISAIWIMMKKGDVSDFQIVLARERTMPYVYAVFGFACWSYQLISILHAPLFLCFIAVGASFAIAIVAVINHWWKISAHLTGFGGLVGGLLTYCLGIGAIPTWWMLSLWLVLSLALMFARLRLDAHTPAQVCAGWLTGMFCTFIPYCNYWYVV